MLFIILQLIVESSVLAVVTFGTCIFYQTIFLQDVQNIRTVVKPLDGIGRSGAGVGTAGGG
jgi:hypothetical protein